MKRVPAIAAPPVPFLADKSVTSLCLSPIDKPGDEDDDGRRDRSGPPKAPRPAPARASALRASPPLLGRTQKTEKMSMLICPGLYCLNQNVGKFPKLSRTVLLRSVDKYSSSMT